MRNKKIALTLIFIAWVGLFVFREKYERVFGQAFLAVLQNQSDITQQFLGVVKKSKIINQKSVLTNPGIISLTNKEREKNNLPPLALNTKLANAALIKAKDMFELQYFEHTSPSGAGPSDLASKSGYKYVLVGENLATGDFSNNMEVVQGWMNSPGHRENILNARYTEIGVAVVFGTYKGSPAWMAVQEFGLPSSACPAVDPKLSSRIDSNEAEIKSLEKEASFLASEIKNMNSRDPGYNDKINQYNSLSNRVNNLIDATTLLIDQYNKGVEKVNRCINGS